MWNISDQRLHTLNGRTTTIILSTNRWRNGLNLIMTQIRSRLSEFLSWKLLFPTVLNTFHHTRAASNSTGIIPIPADTIPIDMDIIIGIIVSPTSTPRTIGHLQKLKSRVSRQHYQVFKLSVRLSVRIHAFVRAEVFSDRLAADFYLFYSMFVCLFCCVLDSNNIYVIFSTNNTASLESTPGFSPSTTH